VPKIAAAKTFRSREKDEMNDAKRMSQKNETEQTNIRQKTSLRAKGVCVNCDQRKFCNFVCFGEEVLFCEEYSFRNSADRRSMHSALGRLDFEGIDVKNLIPVWE
jgi:hypothetical protein